MLRSSVRRAVPLAAATVLALAFSASAATSYNNEITFATAGAEGNFDLDSQVPNGSGATWSVASQTDWDTTNGTPHFFKVRTVLGTIANSGFQMSSPTLINTYDTTDDPDDGGTKILGWAHETASMAYDSYHSKWVVVYSSMPKHQPDTDHVYGKNEVKYGWLARKVFNNTSGQTAPDLTNATSVKEDRIICGGGSTGCSNTLYSATSGWAQGTPTNYNWIDPTNGPCASYPTNCSNGRYYIAWTEPGLIADSSGNVFMSITGIFDADTSSGTDYRGDVHYFKSTDSGATWTWIAKTLDYLDASAGDWSDNYSYFTASSLWWDGSNLRLVVTQTDIDEGSTDKNALYKGQKELKFTSLTSGVVNKTSGRPTVYWCGDYSGSIHRGAGGYYPPTGQHQMSILFPDGEGATSPKVKDFHVYEANGTDC